MQEGTEQIEAQVLSEVKISRWNGKRGYTVRVREGADAVESSDSWRWLSTRRSRLQTAMRHDRAEN
jgi:hypothetical protein